jgi:AcrR family transcriptional regulator
VTGAQAVADWREARRRSARVDIVEAAWSVVREMGLAGLSMRDLATRAGVTTPTLYAYFDSKNAIYDAMFAEAAVQFAAYMAPTYVSEESSEALVAVMRGFVEFCTANVARYQLLFQRTIPGFEPSAESYSQAVTALDSARHWLVGLGVVSEGWQLDLLTALMTGLVDQQIANDPGGQRWVDLIDDAVAMFVAHCRSGRHAETRGHSTARNRMATSRRGRLPERPAANTTTRRKRHG